MYKTFKQVVQMFKPSFELKQLKVGKIVTIRINLRNFFIFKGKKSSKLAEKNKLFA
jgi:hypothetical protein